MASDQHRLANGHRRVCPSGAVQFNFQADSQSVHRSEEGHRNGQMSSRGEMFLLMNRTAEIQAHHQPDWHCCTHINSMALPNAAVEDGGPLASSKPNPGGTLEKLGCCPLWPSERKKALERKSARQPIWAAKKAGRIDVVGLLLIGHGLGGGRGEKLQNTGDLQGGSAG